MVQVPYMVSKVPFLWFPAGYTPVHIATKIRKLDKLCFKTDLAVEVFVVYFGYIQFLKLQGQKHHGHRVHWKNRSMEWWGFPKLSFSRAWKSGSIWYLALEDPQSVLFFLLPGKKRKREFHIDYRDMKYGFSWTWSGIFIWIHMNFHGWFSWIWS